MQFQDSRIVRNSFHGEDVTVAILSAKACVCRCCHVQVLWWVWHALNRCLEHQCMCRCVRFDMCVLTPVHIFMNTFFTGYVDKLVYAKFVH